MSKGRMRPRAPLLARTGSTRTVEATSSGLEPPCPVTRASLASTPSDLAMIVTPRQGLYERACSSLPHMRRSVGTPLSPHGFRGRRPPPHLRPFLPLPFLVQDSAARRLSVADVASTGSAGSSELTQRAS